MLIEIIDKYYQNKRSEKVQTHFYITDCGKCPRAVYFSMKGYPKKELEARVLRVFEHGDSTHERIMRVLYSLGLVVAREVEIPNEEVIHGRCDGIISIKGKEYIIEIKTIRDFKFAKLVEPETAHRRQINLYMHYFRKPQGIVLYESKDTQNLKEFIVEYDLKLCKEILQRFEELKYQIENDILPQKPLDLESWQCDYCDYKEECDKILT